MATPLSEIVEHRLPRLLAGGADYNDVRLILSRVQSLRDWCPEWKRLAAMHQDLGETALSKGRTVTAADALCRASLYYHFAQFVFFEDAEEKYSVQQLQQAAYRKGMAYFRPPTEQLAVRFEDITLAGNLRLPGGDGKAPCVILMAGADSTKEEFFTLENEFLRRGLATFSFDGPGQGPTWRQQKLRPDYEKPVAAVLDRLSTHSRLDARRVGIWGRSFGGYAAPRAAAFDRRLKACATIGGFFDMGAIWSRFPSSTKEALVFGFGAASEKQAAAQSRTYTLAGVLKSLTCPLLIVHSGMDEVCPVAEAERIKSEAAGPTTLRVFDEGNHVCDNIPYKVRAMMGDWLAEQLA